LEIPRLRILRHLLKHEPSQESNEFTNRCNA